MVLYYLETVILNIYGAVFVSGLWQVIRLSFILIYCVTSHIHLDIYIYIYAQWTDLVMKPYLETVILNVNGAVFFLRPLASN